MHKTKKRRQGCWEIDEVILCQNKFYSLYHFLSKILKYSCVQAKKNEKLILILKISLDAVVLRLYDCAHSVWSLTFYLWWSWKKHIGVWSTIHYYIVLIWCVMVFSRIQTHSFECNRVLKLYLCLIHEYIISL